MGWLEKWALPPTWTVWPRKGLTKDRGLRQPPGRCGRRLKPHVSKLNAQVTATHNVPFQGCEGTAPCGNWRRMDCGRTADLRSSKLAGKTAGRSRRISGSQGKNHASFRGLEPGPSHPNSAADTQESRRSTTMRGGFTWSTLLSPIRDAKSSTCSSSEFS